MQQSAYGSRLQERSRIPNLRQVRLIDTDGNQIGIVGTKEAFGIAHSKGLDLVEVAPNADPPVVKIMDYGKYRYRQNKREKAKNHNHKPGRTKEIKLSPAIAEHDYKFKRDHAEEFLRSGSKTIFTIPFKGRAVTHPELGRKILLRLAEELSEVGEVVSPPQLKGRFMSMIMIPQTK